MFSYCFKKKKKHNANDCVNQRVYKYFYHILQRVVAGESGRRLALALTGRKGERLRAESGMTEARKLTTVLWLSSHDYRGPHTFFRVATKYLICQTTTHVNLLAPEYLMYLSLSDL